VNLTQNIYLSFASAPKSVCFVTYWRNMWPWRHHGMYFT